MTEQLEEQEIWVVIGAMTWGKDDDFKAAFTNWFKHCPSSYIPCEVNIHRFTGLFDPKQVTVDEMGTVSFPKVAKHTKLEAFNVTKKMADAYHGWSYLCEEVEYSDNNFTAAFDV